MSDLISGIEKSENESKLGSLKKAACNVSARFRNSFTRRGRRNSRIMSVAFEDEHDAEEMQAVDSFRQTLILEEPLPPKNDHYHMLLRILNSRQLMKSRNIIRKDTMEAWSRQGRQAGIN